MFYHLITMKILIIKKLHIKQTLKCWIWKPRVRPFFSFFLRREREYVPRYMARRRCLSHVGVVLCTTSARTSVLHRLHGVKKVPRCTSFESPQSENQRSLVLYFGFDRLCSLRAAAASINDQPFRWTKSKFSNTRKQVRLENRNTYPSKLLEYMHSFYA